MTSMPSASSARASWLSSSAKAKASFSVAVVAVRHRVHDRHGARQGELQAARGVGPRELRFEGVDAAFQPQRRHHLRHHRLVAVVADSDLDLVREIDALDLLEEAVHEMLPRLLAVGHDVDAGVLLLLDPQQRGIGLGLAQGIAFSPPPRPELAGLREPARLGQAASDRGREHVNYLLA